MSTTWNKVTAGDVKPGDRVRRGDSEITVSRVEPSFMGMPDMIAFIEDTPERWLKLPTRKDAELEVLSGG
jgi:hypothetical protein